MRSTRNQPFCWQEKKIFRALRKKYSGSELVKLRCLYGAITEMDSDFNGTDIKFYTKTIFRYTGLSKEWIPTGLKVFENMKALEIKEERYSGKFKGKRLIFTPDNVEEIPLKTVTEKTDNGKTDNGKVDTSEDISLSEDISYKKKEVPSSPLGEIPYIHNSGEISGYIRSWNTHSNLQFCKLTVLQFGSILNEIRDQLQPYLPTEVEKSFANFSAILKDQEKYPHPIRYPTGIKGFLMKGVHVYGNHAKPFEQFRDPEYEEPQELSEEARELRKEMGLL